MKLAITDACIFIDLCDLEITQPFFALDLEIHTSVDVFNELYPEQQQILNAYQAVGKLVIHSISENDRRTIMASEYPRSLSEMDKTVLHLALKLDAIILSSDKAVRNYGKLKKIEYHGLIWIFDELIKDKLITTQIAKQKLALLLHTNDIYQFSPELKREIDKRVASW